MALIYPVQADAPEPEDGTEPDFAELAADLSDTWLVEIAVGEDGDDACFGPLSARAAWDLARERLTTEQYADYMRAMFPMLDHVPIAFVTARKGKNALRLLQLAIQLHKQAGTRVTTGDLNRAVRRAGEANPPPMRNGRLKPLRALYSRLGFAPVSTVMISASNPAFLARSTIS